MTCAQIKYKARSAFKSCPPFGENTCLEIGRGEKKSEKSVKVKKDQTKYPKTTGKKQTDDIRLHLFSFASPIVILILIFLVVRLPSVLFQSNFLQRGMKTVEAATGLAAGFLAIAARGA